MHIWDVTTKTVAYTNHTILAEALEKWPISYLKKAVPQLMPIIEVLDDKVRRKYDDSSVYIIDREERVHMAHIDIHYSSSVNGVASLHTDILKNVELNNFYRIYPEKFNNKTNGITFRRWLLHSNPQLTELIISLIGDGYKKDATQLEKLLEYKDNEEVILEEDAIGIYSVGNSNDEIRSANNKIYINELSKGKYKLIGDNNKEVKFEIDESGKIIGKVKENTKETRKLVSTAVAELIIMIQTGIEKVNYIMIILTLLVTISSLLYIVKKTNVKES